jgi:type I phosphodiesterase/nucleotide pyrophosphatase
MPRAQLTPAVRAGVLLLFLSLFHPVLVPAQSGRQTRNLILVTLDGVRWQELFTGMDSVISQDTTSGVQDLDRLRQRYWRTTPEARRRALMPFFWDSLVPRATLLGNRTLGSEVSITNRHGFSAPGYEEILTGQAQPDVTSNDPVRYPHRTVLEHLRQALGLSPSQVAVFASWENIRFYAASRPEAIFVNAGHDTVPLPLSTPDLSRLAALEVRALPLWDGCRLDAFTGAMAIEYLKRRRPRVLYLSLDDTDDIAHLRRYDRLLEALHAADDLLRELWQTVQSIPSYRNHTTLVITTDHGRGRTAADWGDHGEKVPGSTEIWVGVIGPDTPHLGEVANGAPAQQADIAATMLGLMGLDPRAFNPEAGPPLPGVGAGR